LGGGREIAAERTAIYTTLVRDWAEEQRQTLGYHKPFAVVALGGTGRAEMAPFSDNDFAFLFDDALEGNPFLLELRAGGDAQYRQRRALGVHRSGRRSNLSCLRHGRRAFTLRRVQFTKGILIFALAVLLAGRANAAEDWQVVHVEDRDYVSFANVAQFYRFPRFTQVSRTVSLGGERRGIAWRRVAVALDVVADVLRIGRLVRLVHPGVAAALERERAAGGLPSQAGLRAHPRASRRGRNRT